MEYFDFNGASGFLASGRLEVNEDDATLFLDQVPDSKDKPLPADIGHETPSEPVLHDAHHPKERKNGTRFSRETVRVLKTWLSRHNDYPYPTEEEMIELTERTGLTSTQIRNWFANARRRGKARSAPVHSTTGAIDIPGQHNLSLMTPLERWKYSPPEHEPAATGNIIRALSEHPFEPLPPLPADSALENSAAIPAPSESSVDTGRSSTTDWTASAGSHSSSSATGLENRKDRRRRRRRKPANYVNKFTQHKSRRIRMFQCTFCTDTFSTKYDWQRHEKSLHLPLETWNCSPFGGVVPLDGKLVCAFCQTPDPDDDHLDSHNYILCQEKDPQERVFYRKDHLNQHLRYMHHVKFDSFMNTWKSGITEFKSRCGFCNANLNTWDGRVAHLAEHFKKRADMCQWRGDWGFEPSVLNRVANAMPPYLIGEEQLTMNPFTADRTNELEIETNLNQPALRDQEDANSWRRLQQELTAYIQQQLGVGIIPTDAMLQDHAREVIYGCDDPWNQTCADNPIWLSFLKRDNGIETLPDSELIQLENLGMQPPFALNGGLQLPPLETNDMARTIYSRELRSLHPSNWEPQGPTDFHKPSPGDNNDNSYIDNSEYALPTSVPSLSMDQDSTICSSFGVDYSFSSFL
ncbi:hypothetical protein BDV25DRAFT_171772 [Aspergillus avenaceus]|uniref:Homeobox and C2H2 transcription factor n=1 Tax=Aspergillus avenaceus TaxID=36643 RepID=A0A5N6U7E6_ASPAV|nr:hypothetical protein BDV25DRAFT_171772 [Aspergillus avenaceus]